MFELNRHRSHPVTKQLLLLGIEYRLIEAVFGVPCGPPNDRAPKICRQKFDRSDLLICPLHMHWPNLCSGRKPAEIYPFSTTLGFC